MRTEGYYIGLDIGTSSVRAVLFDDMGYQIHKKSSECTLKASKQGYQTLQAEVVFNQTLAVLKGCIEEARCSKFIIQGIGISCHMHSLMAVDSDGNPLTELMTWADTRAGAEAKWLEETLPWKEFYQRTGCRVTHPMYPLNKLLWLKEKEPTLFLKATKFITIKEYILHKLYGVYCVDYTLASSQGYFDLHKHVWDESLLKDVLKLGTDKFSSVEPCSKILRGMKQRYADYIGVQESTPMIIGSGDGILANIGSGVIDPKSMASTIGTSGALRAIAKRPLLDDEARTWCYAFTKEQWVMGGAINNGGLVLKWLRDTFFEQYHQYAKTYGSDIYEVFNQFASEVEPGSEGLTFLPYLTGERSPDWRAEVRGMMTGLSTTHNQKHMIRAAMEGILYRMYSVYEVMEKLNPSVMVLKANGGYAQSDVWLQIQADLFNKSIQVPEVYEASALGAAYLSMTSLGAWEYGKPLPSMKEVKVFIPDPSRHETYQKGYDFAMKMYRAIYPEVADL